MGRIKKLLLIGGLCLLNISLAFGQSSISGTVKDQKTGTTLPGTNVSLKGTSRGASTDVDGHYTISNVSAGTYTLVASFIGYQPFTKQIEVTDKDLTIDIELKPQVVGLEDVVVTALGIKREERSLGYSTQQISGESVQKSHETNVVSSLAGKTAGVQITGSSGEPGSPARIIIRGNSSLTGNNQPLFVVDGVPISNSGGGGSLFSGSGPSRAVDLDPNIIESMSVLKGASATALYGSRAANGAIIITTKGGSPGSKKPLRVKIGSSVGIGTAILDGYQNTYLQGDHGYYSNGLPLSRGGYVEPGYPGSDPQTFFSWGPNKNDVSQQVLDDLGVSSIQTYDPRKQFFDNSMRVDNHLSFSGGDENSSYFFSASNLNNQGIVPGSKLDRTSILAKFTQKLTDRLTMSNSANYVSTQDVRFPTGNTHRSYTQNLQNTAISFDITDYEYKDGAQRYQTDTGNNPIWLIKNSEYDSDTWRLIGNTNLSYDITPWLSLNERLGIDTYSNKGKQQWNVNVVERPAGQVVDNKQDRTEINSDLTLNFDKQLNDDLSINGLVGNNINSRSSNFVGYTANGLSVPGFYDVSNATQLSGSYSLSDHRLVSLYGQATLGYKDYLYLNLTGRNDWSSTLPKDNNSYFYPSASVSLLFTQLLDMEDSILNYGKVRFSASQVGNDAPPYSIRPNLVQSGPSDGERGSINYPYHGINGYQEGGSLGNKNLKPELTTEYEAGLELRFLSSRLTLDATYYNRTTKDQIFTVSISNTTGYGGKLANAGSIRNKGWEISLGGTPVQTKDFTWNMQLNYTRNRTDVIELAPGVESISIGGYTAPNIRVLPKEDGYGIIWGQKYEHSEDGQVLVDDDGYPVYKGNIGEIGNVTPDYTANLRTTFNYKNLSLSALFDTKQGNDVLNFNYWDMALNGTAKVTEDRGTTFVYPGVNENTGQPNTKEIVKDQDYYLKYWWPVYENYVEDGSYIKLREVSLSYDLPSKLLSKTPLKGVQLTATGRNLWISTDFTMGDPEGNIMGDSNAQGFYHELTPSTRSYVFSVNVSF